MKTTRRERWHVEADPEHAGKHPLHDNRFICRENGDIVCALRDQSTQATDAALLASSPDLLEACELIAAHLKDLGESNPGYMRKLVLQDYELWNRAHVALRSAIAKAAGE